MAEEEKVTQSSDTVEEKVTQPDEENSIVIDSEDTTPEEETKETETPDTKEEEPTEKKENEVNQDNPEEVSTALKGKGIDYDALTQEYMTTGSLSSASMKKLQEVGISADMVDNYIKGCEARMEAEKNELAECVGGREQMDTIIDWAAHNLPKEEILSINSIRDKYQLKNTLIGLKNRMEEKEGVLPNYQSGDGGKTTVNGFRSQAEMFEAIKDPKYQKDEAYRADVQKKIAASREAGIDLGIY